MSRKTTGDYLGFEGVCRGNIFRSSDIFWSYLRAFPESCTDLGMCDFVLVLLYELRSKLLVSPLITATPLRNFFRNLDPTPYAPNIGGYVILYRIPALRILHYNVARIVGILSPNLAN